MINLKSQYSVYIKVSFLFKTYIKPCITKPTKWPLCPAKTQITLCIRPGRLECLLCVQWVAKDKPVFGCSGWSESSLGRHVILLVISCGGSFSFVNAFKDLVWHPGMTKQLVGRRIKRSMVCTTPYKACLSFTTPATICLYQHILAWKHC